MSLSDELIRDWQIAAPLLKKALAHSGDTHSLDDVLDLIFEKQAFLVTGRKSAIVYQIMRLPNFLQLHYWLAAGDWKELAEMEKNITANAKKRGFNRVTLIGRRGWKRRLSGFEEQGVILTKDI